MVGIKNADNRGRSPQRAAAVESLDDWLQDPRRAAVRQIVVIRTSSTSRINFSAMFEAGVAMLPNDPDVAQLAEIGHRIVLDEGADERARLGALELRRGSVAGVSGRALLGWLVPVGHTVFVLYLQTARLADVAGETPDQAKNCFTEAMCQIVRALKPARVYAPLLSRLFRNRDFAAQLMRTLREYRTDVWVEGKRFPLTGSEGALTSLIHTHFAAMEADSNVARLGAIEASIYEAGQWYTTSRLLPFTWRPVTITRHNPLTGETERHVPNDRDLEVTPGSVAAFDQFVQMLSDPTQSLHDVGMALGTAGVRERAPRHFGDPRLLSDLAQPATAVASLIQQRWLDVWLTGIYSTSIKLKSDLRDSHPKLSDHIAEREDGTLWLDVEIPLPVPERGHWLTGDMYDRLMLVRRAPTPQRLGRAASTGDRRPLSSLAQWDDRDAGRQYRLGTFDSSHTYSVLWRPLATAYNRSGHGLGWDKRSKRNKLAAVNCQALHESIGAALIQLASDLEGQIAPLIVPANSSAVGICPVVRARTTRDTAADRVARIDFRLRGIRRDRQEARGRDDDDEVAALDEDRAEALLALDEARDALDEAEKALETASASSSEPKEAPAGTRALLSSLELVGVALTRCGAVAPASLNDALARLLGTSLRVHPTASSLAVVWECTASIPLVDGGAGTYHLTSPQPVPGIAFTVRASGGQLPNPDWQDRLAEQYFGQGIDYPELGRIRNLDGSGRADTYLVKQMMLWLGKQGVPVGLRAAASDAPPEVRIALRRALLGGAGTAFERHLLGCYTSPAGRWSSTWAAEDGDIPREIVAAVESAGGGGPVAAALAAQLTGVPMASLTEHSLARRQVTRGTGIFAGPIIERVAGNWARGAGPVGRDVALRRCPHADCLGLADPADPVPGILIQLVVPELSPEGLICRSCLRRPDDSQTVFPGTYLQAWRGGRRIRSTKDGKERMIGTRLSATR